MMVGIARELHPSPELLLRRYEGPGLVCFRYLFLSRACASSSQTHRNMHASFQSIRNCSGQEKLDTHRQPTGGTLGCGSSLRHGKLPTVETRSARLFGPGTPKGLPIFRSSD